MNVASPLGQLFAANSLGDSYMAFNTTYHDTGLFGVYAVSPKGGPATWHCRLPDFLQTSAWSALALPGSCALLREP